MPPTLTSRWSILFSLEAMRAELQCPTVFSHGPHRGIGHALRNLGLDFQGDLYLGTEQSAEMLDHLLGDSACITAHSRGVHVHGAMKSCRQSWCRTPSTTIVG